MATYKRVTDRDAFEAPWGRVVRLQEVEYEGGLTLLRIRIREGRRFTDLELTPDTARDGFRPTAWAAGSGTGCGTTPSR